MKNKILSIFSSPVCLPNFQVTRFYQVSVTFHVNSALARGQLLGPLLALPI